MKKKPEDQNINQDSTVSQQEPAPQQESTCEACEQDGQENEWEQQLAAVNAELAVSKDKYLRIAAEYDNYRKRSVREREAIFSDSTAQAVLTLLPVLDNLERAAAQPTSDEAFAKGVSMTLEQFYECLKKLGVTEIEAQGAQFDPNFHNAVMHVEQEGCDDNTIVEVFQKGFKIGDKVIRHAIVKVAN